MKLATNEAIVLEHLHKTRQLDLNEATKILGVSESTARRVFNSLQQAGKALRTHGGIVLAEQPEYSFQQLLSVRAAEKAAIGRLAATYVQNGDVLYLDCGTTVLCLCQALARRLHEGQVQGLRLFTNSLANMEALAPYAAVNLVGGTYRPARKDFAGFLAETVLRELHFTRCFLGADGIGSPPSAGATDFETAALNRLAIAQADETYILCDSGKFNKKSLVAYAHAPEMQHIITDGQVPAELARELGAAGVQVLAACPAAQGGYA